MRVLGGLWRREVSGSRVWDWEIVWDAIRGEHSVYDIWLGLSVISSRCTERSVLTVRCRQQRRYDQEQGNLNYDTATSGVLQTFKS